MKKIIITVTLLNIFLIGNIHSEEIKLSDTVAMKCKKWSYKIERGNVLTTVYKLENGNWEYYASGKNDMTTHKPDTDNRKDYMFISDGLKIETNVKYRKFDHGICKRCIIKMDFKKLTRKGTGNWQGKPYSINEKCKILNS